MVTLEGTPSLAANGDAPQPEDLVYLRTRRWLVESVLPPEGDRRCTVVELACADDDNQGQRLTVLWELEVDRRIIKKEGWANLASKGFDPARKFAAFLNTLRWNCVTATDPRLFQAPFRAGIKIDAYQMEPLRKALLLPRVNLFIADDTGLGKTIEAGLIARELLLRKKVKTIVVAAPASVLEQWQAELEDRFGLTFEILNRAYLTRMRRERGFAVNPWRTHSRFLISHNLLIDPLYADPMREWLGTGATGGIQAGSLLILDEAHHAAPASGNRYGIETKFTRAVRELSKRFEHRLFLSATPHNGHSSSFAALLEILDPYRFTRGVKVRPEALQDVMVRRLKEDVRKVLGTDSGFPERQVVRIALDNLPPDAPELVLSRLLDEYRAAREARYAESDARTQASAGLLVTGLQQRLLSSIEAFARTLRVHRNGIEAARSRAASPQAPLPDPDLADTVDAATFLRAPDADDDRADLPDDAIQAQEDAQVATTSAAVERVATTAAGAAREAQRAHEEALLLQMARIADATRHEPDAKLRYLIDWIRTNLCPDLPPYGTAPEGDPPRWLNRRVIIFTENREGTKAWLRRTLAQAIAGTHRAEERIAVIDGLTAGDRRTEVQRRFNADPSRDPLRILLATDAAREGLNLQAHCTDLFHFDLPWNPGRIEQRNGRIDRKLQPEPVVRCHYFVLPQRTEDRVLQVLVRKSETIREQLGSLSTVIDDRIERLLARGIRHRDVASIAEEIEHADLDARVRKGIEEEVDRARTRELDLRRQIDECDDLIEASRRWVGFEAEPFRDALSCALELLDVEGLAPAPADGGGASGQWQLPPLERLAAREPSWLRTLDSLRPPRRADLTIAEWRRTAAIRPVVFEDTGRVTNDVVQLHLDQRVVQRLLARFAAQGFTHEDLSRACLVQTRDALPRVVLLGRLALYGTGAERLHEEVIAVAARWRHPDRRAEQPIEPYGADGEARTLDVLNDVLRRPQDRTPAATVRDDCLRGAADDVATLLAPLERRAAEAAEVAIARLTRRGAEEAASLRTTLERQMAHVQAEVDLLQSGARQLPLGYTAEDAANLEADRRHWVVRLRQFREDLEVAPARYQQFYAVKARRVEPIGLVYLMPDRG
jgi:hypothetical protein